MKSLTKSIVSSTVLASLPLFAACGETVNYETEVETRTLLGSGQGPLASEAQAGDASSGQDADTQKDHADASQGKSADSTGDASLSREEILALCASEEQLSLRETVVFPELAAGRTCSFGSGENLSRKDLFFRAQLRQDQSVALPAGAVFCGFSLSHQSGSMRYDDEMFFLLNDRILLSTKDYSEYFQDEGMFQTFSWLALRDKPYDALSTTRGLYCAGGSAALSHCQLPPTETTGQIQLKFSPEMTLDLASQLFGANRLLFSWVTTGDNDDTDCRHSPISFNMDVHYVLP